MHPVDTDSSSSPAIKGRGDLDTAQDHRNDGEMQLSEKSVGDQAPEEQYPGKKVVIPIVLSVCLASFLASLDRTIIGVAVPAISNEFNSFADISWYESGYLLTFAALQLPMGKIYTFFRTKWVFIATILIFEIGSTISAAAPTSTAFIVDRTISGVGGAGLTAGSQVVFVDLLPLAKRPKYQGFLGATFGVASIAGPLLGGVFASKASWRWCFWINLPIGAVAAAVLLVMLPPKPPPRTQNAGETFWQRLKQFDPVGTALMLPGLILLLLALQWGGIEGWTSKRVLACLILGIALLVAFGAWQIWAGENGTVPPRIIRQRSIAAAAVTSLGFGSVLIIVTFYVPIWYQAIQGLTAVDAGIRMMGYFLSTVVFVIGSGIITSKIGYYTPPLIIGTAIAVVGCGLLTTLRVDTSSATVIGYQVLTGAGLGLSLIQTVNAAQTVLSREDIPVGITLINFGNLVGGTIFVSVCQGVLSGTLTTELAKIPGGTIDVHALLGSGATDVRKLLTPDQLPAFLAAYNKGIDNIFYVALAAALLAFVASLFLEGKSVKKAQPQQETVAVV
ncbi:major facilitator superfamily transporter [Apiospora rasikravindrae]|uniref:Major facilitator superfamily transporter n=1 Tax=Apiospora rasikravindrae TaxID=990691 RepID=A0ABR1SR67_9PEZI